MKSTKFLFASKTVLVNLVIAVSAVFPPVKELVAENPSIVLTLIAAINFVLRLITRSGVSLFPSDGE